jgi:hypothetical protein
VGGPAALQRSFAMVKSDLLRVFLVALVFGIIAGIATWVGTLVGGIPAGIVGGIFGAMNLQLGIYIGLLVASIVGAVVAAAVLPFTAAGTALLYFDLRRKKDRQANQLREQLEELVG